VNVTDLSLVISVFCEELPVVFLPGHHAVPILRVEARFCEHLVSFKEVSKTARPCQHDRCCAIETRLLDKKSERIQRQ